MTKTMTAARNALALALGVAAFVPAAQAQRNVPMAPRPSIVVFPLDAPEGTDASVAETATNGIRTRLNGVAQYEAMTFNPRSPLVQRAVQSNNLSSDQVAGPFDATKGAAVSSALGANYALVGSVVDSVADAANNRATASISVQLVNASDARVIQTVGVSGEATASGMAPDALMRLAADNAAGKAVAQMFATTAGVTIGAPSGAGTSPVVNPAPAGLPTGTITNGQKRKRSSGLLVLGGIALVAAILAGSSGGGGGNNGGNNGGNGGNGGPPPFPF